ncbi:hypothetical protein QEH52_11095 [Coraliomargarita sp. SDUM461003]|uniref:Uncharacterized protein n=1 Tax=Thalassobacterium maritimum TaxID=3041265 RepID=A0ABU1AYL6_9BACT|nr:hypothetical protein [Coraliomargarita sp. SDUM461003]MDQ8208057.1 hypothetical protein [Coraliomargarita sp. SDUM461003]
MKSNKMKALVITPFLFLLSLVASADLRDVGYKIGPQLFRYGDSIEIKEVKASSSGFETGETVIVKGTYSLRSHPDAKIGVFVTQTESHGKSEILPGQQMEIIEGDAVFELSIEIRYEGYLHVTFYPTEGGRGFGGVYFGKSKQMKEIEDWTLDWYLGEPLPEGKSGTAPVIQSQVSTSSARSRECESGASLDLN